MAIIQSRAVLVGVLLLVLTQVLKGVQYALILLRQLIELVPSLRLLPNPVADIAVLLLLHPVLQSKSSDLQGLPPNLPKMLLSERELLHVLRPINQFYGTIVHTLLPLCRCKRIQVLQQDLVF